MQPRLTRKSFLAKLVAGLSVAGFTSSLFATGEKGASRAKAAGGPVVKAETRAVSRQVSGSSNPS